MPHPLSLHKSVTVFPLLATAIVGSLLTSLSLPKSDLLANAQTMPTATPSVLSQVNADEDEIGVNREAVLAIAFAGSAAIGLTLTALTRRSRSSRSSTARSNTASQHQSHSPVSSQANRFLLRKLMRLLHEDHQAAARLLAQAEIKHPGKSADWYVEKVIFDLQRDRGKY
ncbi:MAG: hypothetical protein HC769_29475 [Cyanobacteria bacterium CRU_2_1]|nr:hypothetical protein [Cyanobacteria bacterium RU_5_0]NJR62569.1 hypothetical protein [Cyanobacteria bacterium CRU_2_1]